MAAIFYSEDVKKLLMNSFVVIIGDSNQRGIYKDLILLLQANRYLTDSELKSKGTKTCLNDVQLEQSPKSNGVDYREVREYKTNYHWVRYYFVTRVNSKYMTSVINNLMNLIPDILIMNSCVWDISRYGPHSMNAYKKNLEKTFNVLKNHFWNRCRIIWNTALPVASKIKGGFLLPELSSLCGSLNREVIEGNYYACQLAELNDFDVIDLHYLFKELVHWRAKDGIHWKMIAHRRISNIILTHICESWQIEAPRHKFEMFGVAPRNDGPMEGAVNSAPRPKIPRSFNFTELDDLPQFMNFDNPSAMPNLPEPEMQNPPQMTTMPNQANLPKEDAQRIPPLMKMAPVRNGPSKMLPPHMPPRPRLPPQPYLPPGPHFPPRQSVFHPEVLHSMRQFWQMYVGHGYGYDQRYGKPYDPRMFCQYPDHASVRHAPYQNIMSNARMDYMRRQQERIQRERSRSFRYVRVMR